MENFEEKPKILLASTSPMRMELLEKTNLIFRIDGSNIDETSTGDAEQRVRELAQRKAQAVQGKYVDHVIIGADTLVEIEGQPLGKPETAENAITMLKMLSGKWHHVYTGICVLDGRTGKTHFGVEKTDVLFSVLDEQLIKAYVDTREPLDKAGGYGIQGLGEILVEEIRGSYSNVVGLPLSLLRKMLAVFQIQMLPRENKLPRMDV